MTCLSDICYSGRESHGIHLIEDDNSQKFSLITVMVVILMEIAQDENIFTDGI